MNDTKMDIGFLTGFCKEANMQEQLLKLLQNPAATGLGGAAIGGGLGYMSGHDADPEKDHSARNAILGALLGGGAGLGASALANRGSAAPERFNPNSANPFNDPHETPDYTGGPVGPFEPTAPTAPERFNPGSANPFNDPHETPDYTGYVSPFGPATPTAPERFNPGSVNPFNDPHATPDFTGQVSPFGPAGSPNDPKSLTVDQLKALINFKHNAINPLSLPQGRNSLRGTVTSPMPQLPKMIPPYRPNQW